MKSKNIIKIITGTIIATTIISPVVPVIQNISVFADTTIQILVTQIHTL